MIPSAKWQLHDAQGRCNCLGYAFHVKMMAGQFAQVAAIATGKPKQKFFSCGSDLHEFIEEFQKSLQEADMPVYVSEGSSKNYTPHPEGLYQAVCAQVIDLGMQETQWGEKPKVDLVFQLGDAHLRDDGKRFCIKRRYTKSLNERSTLRKELEVWRAKKFSAAELAKFDLEVLVGINCKLQLTHQEGRNGGTFANIQFILPPDKGAEKLTVKVEDIPKPKTDFAENPEAGYIKDVPF